MNFKNIKIILALILFIVGLQVVSSYTTVDIENFETGGRESPHQKCADLLIQKDNILYLYKKREPEIPGVNPILFNNLEEYIEYIEYQRSKGIHCPVLHLRHIHDAQGENSFKVFPSPEDTRVGLSQMNNTIQFERGLIDAGHDKGSMPSYDDTRMNLGVYTPLDDMFHSKESTSDSAMDTHWGGVRHSQKAVDSGKYDDNTRLLTATQQKIYDSKIKQYRERHGLDDMTGKFYEGVKH